MRSVEARNSTNELASPETNTTAALAREESSAGFFNPEEQASGGNLGNYTREFDHVDATGNYREYKLRFRKKKADRIAYRNSWSDVVHADGFHHNQEFDTGEIESIQSMTEKINSGELYPTAQIVEQLGERALALVSLVDVELPAAQVERTIAGVVAIHPEFEAQAIDAVDRIYHDNRPGITPDTQKVARETIHKIAQVAAHPDDYIDLDNVIEPTPSVNRIVEQAVGMVMAPRINRIVQQKEWDEEDRIAAEREKISA
jgi:hypothetical protein